MIKKQNTKKRIILRKREHVLWLIVLVLCLLQILSILWIAKLQGSINHGPDLSMKFLLRNAEEDRYKYPIIDVAANRVYIPEARIYLPLNEASRDMRYDFRTLNDSPKSTALYFSTSSVVGRQTGAQYESCDKMVTLAQASTVQVVDSSKVDTIQPTKDGLRDIYMHSVGTCWGDWYDDLRDDLAGVIREAKITR